MGLRILIADDHELMRSGMRLVLEREQGWQVVGEAANGRDAVELAKRLKPAIVILDIGMPELNGLEAAKQIKKELPDTEILIFTGVDSEQIIYEVFAAGARAYLLKSDTGKNLISAVKALAEHRIFVISKASEVIMAGFLKRGGPPADACPSRLSSREREVVQMLSEGKSSKEVAAALGISTRTVEVHRAAIMRRLSLKSFSELIRYAIRNKIIEA